MTTIDEAKQPGPGEPPPPRMSELTERDLEMGAAAVAVAEEEDSDYYDEEEGMGLELASGAIKVNVWKQGRKVSEPVSQSACAWLIDWWDGRGLACVFLPEHHRVSNHIRNKSRHTPHTS